MVLGFFESAEDTGDIRGVEMDLHGLKFKTAGGEDKGREKCSVTTVGETGRTELKLFCVGECIGESDDAIIGEQKSAAFL